MDSPASYFNWGFISISLPNLALMAAMIVVFAAAVVLPTFGVGVTYLRVRSWKEHQARNRS